MKKYLFIFLFFVSGILSAQDFIGKTKSYLKETFGEGTLVDNAIAYDYNGEKFTFTFDNVNVCDGSMQQITLSSYLNMEEYLTKRGYSYNKSDGCYYNNSAKIKVWFLSDKTDANKIIMFCKKI